MGWFSKKPVVEAWSYSRGHFIYWDGESWFYKDHRPFDDTRICVECNIPHKVHGPDVCLGMKPGVISACCTHGGRMPSIYKLVPRLTPGEATHHVD